MLVCPQCHFDNPNQSQYCQKCGTSLTWKICPECSSQVPLATQACAKCGTFTGVLWWAIIAETAEASKEEHDPILQEYYLDLGQRYRFNSVETQVCEGQVLDCQPLQKSVLKVLLEQEQELGGMLPPLDQPLASWEGSSWIPPLALPYLALQEFCPAIPDIHDAWQQGTKQVILLSDRSNWQGLHEAWSNQSSPSLQIVYSLDEMAKLWKALAQIGYGQSLLIKSNLRFDEDQTFGLQRLYQDIPDHQLSIKDLAKLWQELLQIAEVQVSSPLAKVLAATVAGEIDSVTNLRLHLQELADEQQNNDLPSLNHLPEEVETKTEDYLDTKPQEEVLFGSSSDDLATAVIPMQLLSLTDAGGSDNGRQRRHNEDCFGMDTYIAKQQGSRGQMVTGRGLYIVCDGMGGHASGEVASAMAVESLQRFFKSNWQEDLPSREVIEQGIVLANQNIFQVNQEKASFGSGRMGTTLVMALVQQTKVAIAHVGDSRIYRVNRKWGLEQLTVDHEVGQRAIQEGIDPKIAYSRPDAYQLTQALGPHDMAYLKPDIRFLEFNEDTLLLLCSDGLSDNDLLENHWQTYLTPLLSSSANLDEGLQKLISLGNQKNGHDNLTAILIRIKVQPDLEQSIWF